MLETLSNDPRDYAWGSPTLIPALQGRTPSGAPEAEVWFGDHPGSPARLGDGRTLAEARGDAGAPPLPYLLKILAASSSLSIQAHPDLTQAREGYAREEAAGIPIDAPDRLYRDANHKPEIIVALSDRFRALVGLRPVARTRELLAGLGDREGVRLLQDALTDEDAAGALRRIIEDALSGRSADVVADLAAALREVRVDPATPYAEEIDVLRAVSEDFPGDPGLVVALLMNLVVLRRGDAVFAPAGVLHAYQDGLGVELMAASDNVLRGGLTPKHIDVPELMRIIDTRPGDAPVLVPERRGDADVFDAGVPDFTLVRHVLDGDDAAFDAAVPTIVLAAAGELTVVAGDVRLTLTPGRAAVVDGEPEVRISGRGTAYVARPGTAE